MRNGMALGQDFSEKERLCLFIAGVLVSWPLVTGRDAECWDTQPFSSVPGWEHACTEHTRSNSSHTHAHMAASPPGRKPLLTSGSLAHFHLSEFPRPGSLQPPSGVGRMSCDCWAISLAPLCRLQSSKVSLGSINKGS